MAEYIEKRSLLYSMEKVARNLETEGITDVDDMLDAMEVEMRHAFTMNLPWTLHLAYPTGSMLKTGYRTAQRMKTEYLLW